VHDAYYIYCAANETSIECYIRNTNTRRKTDDRRRVRRVRVVRGGRRSFNFCINRFSIYFMICLSRRPPQVCRRDESSGAAERSSESSSARHFSRRVRTATNIPFRFPYAAHCTPRRDYKVEVLRGGRVSQALAGIIQIITRERLSSNPHSTRSQCLPVSPSPGQ